MKRWIFLFSLFLFSSLLSADKGGTWINPITDICWSCLYPIHIAGSNMTPSYCDNYNYSSPTCHCLGGAVGLPIAFWEPSRIIEVTRVPYKMVSLGGFRLAGKGSRKRGTISSSQGRGRTSLYHVHYYQFPILKLLELAGRFVCIEDFDFDIGYMSEFDPFWMDDQWTAVLHPEAFLFANPLAQAACIADCTASSLNRPLDTFFWCAGCQGSLYPFTGHVAEHIGAIQASSLLVHRTLGKLHTIGMLKGFKEGEFCNKSFMRHVPKSIYKTQLVYPVAQTKGPCNSLGKSDILWGAGKSFPVGGEEFVYLIWTKRHCCLDPIKISRNVLLGGS